MQAERLSATAGVAKANSALKAMTVQRDEAVAKAEAASAQLQELTQQWKEAREAEHTAREQLKLNQQAARSAV